MRLNRRSNGSFDEGVPFDASFCFFEGLPLRSESVSAVRERTLKASRKSSSPKRLPPSLRSIVLWLRSDPGHSILLSGSANSDREY